MTPGTATGGITPSIGEWDGEPGQRVIVYGDQGIGDEIFSPIPSPTCRRSARASSSIAIRD